MKRRRFFFFGLLVACGGAEQSPLFGDDGGIDGGGGDVITSNDGTPIDTGNNCEPTCATIPQGFRPVRMGDANTACPSGWITADGVKDPVASDGACTCSCNVTQNPDCSNGTVTRAFDDTTSPTCGNTATQFPTTSVCTQIGGTLYLNHTHYVTNGPAPSGGACQYDAKLDKGKLSGTPARVCAPPQSCLGEICDGGAVCIATDGDQACPGEFPTKTVVGQSVTGTCGSCGPCTAAGTCGGTLSLYQDQLCQTTPADLTADGICKPLTVSNVTPYIAYLWKGSLTKASCAGTPSSTAEPALDKAVTVCCK